MAKQTVVNLEPLATHLNKVNSNFTELYDGKLSSTNTKAQFDAACTDDNFAFLGQANVFTGGGNFFNSNDSTNTVRILNSGGGFGTEGALLVDMGAIAGGLTRYLARFTSGGSERLLISSNGDLTVNGQNRTSGWTSFTPTVSGDSGLVGGYSTQIGSYKQQGKVVHWKARIKLSSLGTLSGTVKLNTLPISSATARDNVIGGFVCNTGSNPATSGLGVPFYGSSTQVEVVTSVGAATLQWSGVSTNTHFELRGTYEAS